MKIKKIAVMLMVTSFCYNLQAQKLPGLQQAGMRAPANIIIDGKAIEWGGFKALNTATDTYYTIANDDKKLYLVIHADQSTVANRAVIGGIRLLVQPNGSKSMQGAKGIKFPYFEKGSRVVFPVKKIGEVNTPAEGDSIMKVYNQRIASSVKWIYTKDIVGVDSVIAVYNDKGIQAAGAFDQTRGYTCEIAIDLDLLGISLADSKKFAYNITINPAGPNKFSMPPGISFRGMNSDGSIMSEAQSAPFISTMEKQNNVTYATTDFWGEYTLAK
ncbi:hypothetical protein ACFQZS_01450 [Mucilaginibacter calamicampi]|uniref:Carbohydrate metabolism domain-containing protein n=1 Tax=Mucilaginibacter calamicampi TaxID=1302352 RepID=A0ABW2YR35_9SPHI